MANKFRTKELTLNSNVVNATGNVLYINSLPLATDANLVTSGVNITNSLTLLSGDVIQTGITLHNEVVGLSGKLVETGDSLQTKINTLTTNLVTTGITLHNEIDGMSGNFDARNYVTGISVANITTTLTGYVTFSGRSGVAVSQDTTNRRIFIDPPAFYKSVTINEPLLGDNILLFYTDQSLQVRKMVSVMSGISPTMTFTIKFDSSRAQAGTELTTNGFVVDSATTGILWSAFTNPYISGGCFVWLNISASGGGSWAQFHNTLFFNYNNV